MHGHNFVPKPKPTAFFFPPPTDQRGAGNLTTQLQTIDRCIGAHTQMLPALPQPGTSTSRTRQSNPGCCHTPSAVAQPDYFSSAYD